MSRIHGQVFLCQSALFSFRYQCENHKAYGIYNVDDDTTAVASLFTQLNNHCTWTGVWQFTADVAENKLYCKSKLWLTLIVGAFIR